MLHTSLIMQSESIAVDIKNELQVYAGNHSLATCYKSSLQPKSFSALAAQSFASLMTAAVTWVNASIHTHLHIQAFSVGVYQIMIKITEDRI